MVLLIFGNQSITFHAPPTATKYLTFTMFPLSLL